MSQEMNKRIEDRANELHKASERESGWNCSFELERGFYVNLGKHVERLIIEARIEATIKLKRYTENLAGYEGDVSKSCVDIVDKLSQELEALK